MAAVVAGAAVGVPEITGAGDIIEVEVAIGEGETAGVGEIAGEGATVGTDDVSIVWVQAVNAIVPIPTSNLKYLTLD
jgi:hypothetical protein